MQEDPDMRGRYEVRRTEYGVQCEHVPSRDWSGSMSTFPSYIVVGSRYCDIFQKLTQASIPWLWVKSKGSPDLPSLGKG